jgi:hypothetical protein
LTIDHEIDDGHPSIRKKDIPDEEEEEGKEEQWGHERFGTDLKKVVEIATSVYFLENVWLDNHPNLPFEGYEYFGQAH